MLAITCKAIALDVEEAITQDRFVPNIYQQHAIPALSSATKSSLPEDVPAVTTTPDMTINPRKIVANVQNHLRTNSAIDYHATRIQADNTHLANFELLEDYFTDQESIRTQMINAGYSNISDQRTAI